MADNLEGITRRGFLRVAGAIVGLAAVGAAGFWGSELWKRCSSSSRELMTSEDLDPKSDVYKAVRLYERGDLEAARRILQDTAEVSAERYFWQGKLGLEECNGQILEAARQEILSPGQEQLKKLMYSHRSMNDDLGRVVKNIKMAFSLGMDKQRVLSTLYSDYGVVMAGGTPLESLGNEATINPFLNFIQRVSSKDYHIVELVVYAPGLMQLGPQHVEKVKEAERRNLENTERLKDLLLLSDDVRKLPKEIMSRVLLDSAYCPWDSSLTVGKSFGGVQRMIYEELKELGFRYGDCSLGSTTLQKKLDRVKSEEPQKINLKYWNKQLAGRQQMMGSEIRRCLKEGALVWSVEKKLGEEITELHVLSSMPKMEYDNDKLHLSSLSYLIKTGSNWKLLP